MTLTGPFDVVDIAVVTTDRTGTCTYVNPVARDAIAGVEPGAAFPDAGLDAERTTRIPLGDGGTLYLLRSRDADADARSARFVVKSADGLSGILNLRRTLRRVVDLARDGFGGRTGVDFVTTRSVRSVRTGHGGGVSDETTHRRDLDPVRAAWLDDAIGRGSSQTLAGGELDDASDASDPTILTTVPIRSASGDHGLLWIVSELAACPRLSEVEAFARRAAVAISTARVYEERSELATTLRAALLPAPLPDIPGVQLGAAYRPARETTQIGGDFYDFSPCGDGSWTVSIGDVCGKGVEAAVLTGRVRQSIRTATLVTDEPARVLELVNETLRVDDGSTFVTLVHGRLTVDGEGVHLRLVTGGHLPPLVLRHGKVETVAVRGTIVGMLPDIRFEPVDVHLRPGDSLLLFTDGAPEARGADGLLDMEPITAILADCDGLTAQAVAERILQLVLEHLDGREHDDIALVAIRAEPGPA